MNVCTFGVFDQFSYEDEKFLMRCTDFLGTNGMLTVGVHTDGFVKDLTGEKPVQHSGIRVARVAEELGSYKARVLFHAGSTRAFVRNSKSSLLISRDDAMCDEFAQYGIGVCYLPTIVPTT